MNRRLEILASLGWFLAAPASGAAVPLACQAARTLMEHANCADPSIAARDAAMTILYYADRGSSGAASLQEQRRWLASALACRDVACLKERYDTRNGVLLQQDGGRAVARRYHLDAHGRSGDLLVFRRGSWLSYDATETVVGSGGTAAGDVSAARLGGTARLLGSVAREAKPGGCEVTLQRNVDGSWSMGTRHCFDGDRADLNDRFVPTRETEGRRDDADRRHSAAAHA